MSKQSVSCGFNFLSGAITSIAAVFYISAVCIFIFSLGLKDVNAIRELWGISFICFMASLLFYLFHRHDSN